MPPNKSLELDVLIEGSFAACLWLCVVFPVVGPVVSPAFRLARGRQVVTADMQVTSS